MYVSGNSPKEIAISFLILGVGLIIGGSVGFKKGKINLAPFQFGKNFLLYYKPLPKKDLRGEGAKLWSAIFLGIGLVLLSAGLFYLYYSDKQCGGLLIWDCF